MKVGWSLETLYQIIATFHHVSNLTDAALLRMRAASAGACGAVLSAPMTEAACPRASANSPHSCLPRTLFQFTWKPRERDSSLCARDKTMKHRSRRMRRLSRLS